MTTDEEALRGQAQALRDRLDRLAADDRTLVFYVTPHRAVPDLEAMAEAFGAGREAVLRLLSS